MASYKLAVEAAKLTNSYHLLSEQERRWRLQLVLEEWMKVERAEGFDDIATLAVMSNLIDNLMDKKRTEVRQHGN
jgi:hypothetical protein